MTGTQILAFVVLPIALAGAGWVVVLLSERLSRHHAIRPGE